MRTSKTGRGPLAAGGVAALLASACCLGPLVLITLGVSGAWISNLAALELPDRTRDPSGTRRDPTRRAPCRDTWLRQAGSHSE